MAWIRNWPDRWLDSHGSTSSTSCSGSSERIVEMVGRESAKVASSAPHRDQPDAVRRRRAEPGCSACDVLFIGSYWNQHRDVVDALPALAARGHSVHVHGRGWDDVPGFSGSRPRSSSLSNTTNEARKKKKKKKKNYHRAHSHRGTPANTRRADNSSGISDANKGALPRRVPRRGNGMGRHADRLTRWSLWRLRLGSSPPAGERFHGGRAVSRRPGTWREAARPSFAPPIPDRVAGPGRVGRGCPVRMCTVGQAAARRPPAEIGVPGCLSCTIVLQNHPQARVHPARVTNIVLASVIDVRERLTGLM